MKFLMLIVMFFMVGGLFIVSENNLYMGDNKDLNTFSELYISWLDNTANNVKTITGNIINLDWLPKNQTG